MLSQIAMAGVKKSLTRFSNVDDGESDPNRLAARHALAALEAYDELRFHVAYAEISTACHILNEHHEANTKLRSMVERLHTVIKERQQS